MSFPTGSDTTQSSGHDTQADLRADLAILSDEGPSEGQDDQDEEALSDDEPEADTEVDSSEGGDSEENEEGEEEPTSESDDEEESEEEDEEPEEEKADSKTEPSGHARPTVKQVKEKFPTFFKEFPEMRHMLFREQEYSSLFPTVEEAKDAASRAGDFDMFSTLLQSGKREDLQEFLKGVSEAGPDTLTGMAANFLPSLYNTNKDLYFQVTTPIAESLLKNAYRAAKAAGNTNLENAALHIAQWALGDSAFATEAKSTPPIQTKQEVKDPKLEQEKQAFYQEKYNDVRSFVGSTSQKTLLREIQRGLDPAKVFNEFTSKLLSKQIMDELGAQLEGDQAHMAAMNSLWKQAQKAGYVGNWKDRLLATYLSRARTYLPAIRTRVRNEALKGQEQRHEKVRDIANRSSNRKEIQGSQNSGQRRGSGSGGAPPSSKSIDWSKTSDMDLLNDKVTYRK